jgi:hypothetical protein
MLKTLGWLIIISASLFYVSKVMFPSAGRSNCVGGRCLVPPPMPTRTAIDTVPAQ